MLLTYFILLSLMFVVLLVGGVLGFVFRYQVRRLFFSLLSHAACPIYNLTASFPQVEDNLRPEMRHTIEEYDPKYPESPITAAWDDTQRQVRENSDGGQKKEKIIIIKFFFSSSAAA